MSRLIPRRTSKIGLPAGSIVHIGEKRTEKVKLTLFEYDESGGEEIELASVEEIPVHRWKRGVSWIDVEGLHDPAVIEAIGKRFDLHPLTLEDVVNTGGRSKVEDCGSYVLVVVKLPHFDEQCNCVKSEQISFVFGEKFVISFQECALDIFDAVRERIRVGKGRTRKMGADYLVYALLDEIVDNYFLVVERIGEDVEELELELARGASPGTLKRIHKLRSEMLVLKKSVWPLREVASELARGETPLIKETTEIFLRDVHDHAIQIMDSVETLRDMAAGMMDIYISAMSYRTNEVMKVLTVIATIFMPLTFLAGVYGMNFEYMPELKWHWGYPAVLGVMLTIGVGMARFFRKKRWW